MTPQDAAENWLYAAWQQLTPGDGGMANFTLNQDVSGQLIIPAQGGQPSYTSNLLGIPPGYVAIASNPNGLSPALAAPVPGTTMPSSQPTVTSTQSGIINDTSGLPNQPYAQWLVNGNLTVQSNATIPDLGGLSAFELNTILYWAVGETVIGPTWTYNQVI